MEKEPVTKFDLEAAFKALDELDIPAAEKGIAANRVNLNETFANARNNKLKTELLVEDYYDVNNQEDLESAQAEREEEIAQAKLARIEKIVDLDAESPEDLLPSYVGKVIIQCPQCMTLFYKDPADLEPSEDDDSIVNVNEICQHCGNTSGYSVIGKVDAVSEEEKPNYEEEAPVAEEESEEELNLDFGEPTEEVDAEGTGEAEVSGEDELNLDFAEEETEEEPTEEEEEEEKKEESLNHSKVEREAEEGSELFTDHKTENVSLNEESENESLNHSEAELDAEKNSELMTDNESENKSLNEDIDLDKKLEEHNEYIDYLKKMIEQEEEALKKATNEEVKAAIQRRLEAFAADLEAALPEAVKDDLAAEDLPTPEEAGAAEEVEESLNKSENRAEIAKDELPDSRTIHEEINETVEEDLVTVTVDTEEGREPIVTVSTEETGECTNCEEPCPDCKEQEPLVEPEQCVGPECEVPAVVADIPAVVEVEPAVAEEPVIVSDEVVAAEEPITPEEHEEEAEFNARMAADATAAVDDLAKEFGIEAGDASEEKDEEEEKKEDNDDDDHGNDGGEEVEEGILGAVGDVVGGVVDGVKNLLASDDAEKKDIEEDINITNNDSPSRVDNRDQSGEKPAEAEKTDEGIIGAVKDVVGGVEKGVENILGEEKTEEGIGLFGVGDVNVNLDASGQNNAVGVGGGEGKTEDLKECGEQPTEEGLPTPPGLSIPGIPGLTEEEQTEELTEATSLEEGPIINGIKKLWNKGKQAISNKITAGKQKKSSAAETTTATELYDSGKGYAIKVWLKSPASVGSLGKGEDMRTKIKGGDELVTVKPYITKQTIKEARDLAAERTSHKNTPIADIYGIEEDGKLTLLFTYFYGKDVTEKIKAGSDTDGSSKDYGHSGIASNKIYEVEETTAGSGEYDSITGVTSQSEQRRTAADIKDDRVSAENTAADVKGEEEKAKAKKAATTEECLRYPENFDTGYYWLKVGGADNTKHYKPTDAAELVKQAKVFSAGFEAIIMANDGTNTYELLKIKDGEPAEGADWTKFTTVDHKPNKPAEESLETESLETEALTEAVVVPVNSELFEGLDELDEETISAHITDSLTKVYENVDKFEMTECTCLDNKLIIEGLITFSSLKTRPTKYVFTEASITSENNVAFKGINENLTTDGEFTLACSVKENKLIAESLSYRYHVEDKLVEGYTGK